jgi:hypothetical protein
MVMRVLPVLAAVLAAFLTFASTGAQAAAPAQSLGVVLQRDGAATERLPYYRAAAPITVNVGGDAGRLPSLKLVAHGPSGEAVSAALARTGSTFTGVVQLLAPGAWTLAFSTQFGTPFASVPLSVVSEDGADFAARCAFALSFLSIVAGALLMSGTLRRPRFAYVRKRS